MTIATAAAIFGNLTDAHRSMEELIEAVSRGDVLVTVQTDEHRAGAAAAILHKRHALKL